jgi:hypothetical protein
MDELTNSFPLLVFILIGTLAVASSFLLVAMVGAIVIGKRELSADEEESTPQFIMDRAETEKDVKEAMSA